MKVQIPGKIFISGEYAALKGLPALTVAVKPCFEFEKKDSLNPAFHPESPAGKLNFTLKGNFTDPYKSIGGMGASTAEYLAAAVDRGPIQNIWDTWSQYRELLKSQNTPSGVDLLTQVQGGYCISETRNQKLISTSWNFKNLDWVALITGNKIKTHEHLAKPLSLDWQQIEILNQNVVAAFENADEKSFILALQAWRHFLFDYQLETPASTELIEFFLDVPGVRAAKGCGAMGSDVVLIIFEKNQSETLEKSLQFWNQDHVITSKQVCEEGLKVINEDQSISAL